MKLFSCACVLLWLSGTVTAAPTGMAKRLIEQFHMEKIPDEGPWFTVTYVGRDLLPGAALPARYHGADHATGSAIYDVMTREDFSALHKLQTDETWHFYGGDPVEMLLLYPDGHGETIVIGPDVFAGQKPQFTVPGGVWQGSTPTGVGAEAYSFVGHQLAPAFDYHDFEPGYRDELQKIYPRFAPQIAHLTRDDFAARPAAVPAKKPEAVAPSPPAVFSVGEVKPVEVAPGMFLRELAGRNAPAKNESHSVAHFILERGHATPTSHNKVSVETFLVIRGHGQVMLDGRSVPISLGSVVEIPAGVSHNASADAAEGLEFYAVETPAYSPDDSVVDPERE